MISAISILQLTSFTYNKFLPYTTTMGERFKQPFTVVNPLIHGWLTHEIVEQHLTMYIMVNQLQFQNRGRIIEESDLKQE
ncbi:hypothetical protein CN514_13190 [Bacillus sp. AFS001701]|nr:hypothetical protein CN514_13190 [Bacillus sp. AFS001701]